MNGPFTQHPQLPDRAPLAAAPLPAYLLMAGETPRRLAFSHSRGSAMRPTDSCQAFGMTTRFGAISIRPPTNC